MAAPPAIGRAPLQCAALVKRAPRPAKTAATFSDSRPAPIAAVCNVPAERPSILQPAAANDADAAVAAEPIAHAAAPILPAADVPDAPGQAASFLQLADATEFGADKLH